MTLKIYGAARSRAFRVLWVAEELGLAYEHVPVEIAQASQDPTYLEVNPNGRIPAIDDDGFRLFESLAITQYLVRKHGGPLQPAGRGVLRLLVTPKLLAAGSWTTVPAGT